MTATQKTLALGCMVGLIGAGGALLVARYQQRVQAYYGDGPREFSVAGLIQQGLVGPHWIELTQLKVAPRAVVSAQRGSIDAIRIPVFPRDAADGSPIGVVLVSTKSHSLEEFGLRLRDRTTFRGALGRPTASASAALRKQLAASYPGQPLADQIWELDIDFGGPTYARWAAAVKSTSAGLLVFGVICLFGFIGTCFTAKEALPATSFESVSELRY